MTVERAIDVLLYQISPENTEEENEALGNAAKILPPTAARRWMEGKTMDKISREQVAGCKYCHEEWGTCDPITNRFTMP